MSAQTDTCTEGHALHRSWDGCPAHTRLVDMWTCQDPGVGHHADCPETWLATAPPMPALLTIPMPS
jgi:hypothetical protein